MTLRFLAIASTFAVFGMAQDAPFSGYFTSIPAVAPPFTTTSNSVTALPTWTYNVTASADRGGSSYTGTMLGRSPYDRGKTVTTIPTQIVPLIITITDGSGTHVYDPTVTDSCITTGSHTDVDLITGSPLFTNNSWTMNGVNVGNTQYLDAYHRAQFWSLVGGSNYHLMLAPSTLAAQSLTFAGSGTSGSGSNYQASSLSAGTCGYVGVVNINSLDAAVQALINGPLAAMVNVGTFPVFLTRSVVSAQSGNSIFSSCCILGYHGGLYTGGKLQIYSPFSLDTSGLFGNLDVSTLAHEIGEAVDDPTGTNQTPAWGGIGQVPSGCQGNLENGDPLSPGFSSTTHEFVVSGANGLTYHVQELAFFNWFFGGTSLGAGGKYSNNGSFTGDAKPCPSGGTN